MKLIETQFSTTPEYTRWLKELKGEIIRSQVRAALAASRELILFYWDLTSEFRGVQGLSRTNLYYVKKFYEFFCSFSDQGQFENEMHLVDTGRVV